MKRLFFAVPLTALLLASQAAAHAKLAGSSPAADATVKAGLTSLELTFNEAVEPALSVIELQDGAGTVLVSSKGSAVCAETSCTLAVPALKAGDYTVSYHVLSVDGHVVKGSFGFHVAD